MPSVYVRSMERGISNLQTLNTSCNTSANQSVSSSQNSEMSEDNSQVLLLYRRDDETTKNHAGILNCQLKEKNFVVRYINIKKGQK